jgi:ABC-2 type transport system permease protein
MAKDIQAWKRLLQLQWHNAASLRGSFLLQIFGMMLNNAVIGVVWIAFILIFGTVNGWGVVDILAIQGLGSLTFGLAYSVCYGSVMFHQDIRRGTFDHHFLRPLALLPLVWRSYFSESTFGDITYGLLLVGIASWCSGSLATFMLVIILSIPGAMITLAISTLASSYAFWRPDDRLIGDMIMRMFLTPSMYPMGAFPEAMRIIFSFIIPSLLVAGLPWEAVRYHIWWLVCVLWIAGFAWLGFSAMVFYRGVKRYESGGGVG